MCGAVVAVPVRPGDGRVQGLVGTAVTVSTEAYCEGDGCWPSGADGEQAISEMMPDNHKRRSTPQPDRDGRQFRLNRFFVP
jgi:hypothetical protein